MASIYIPTNPPSSIEYSLSGDIREVMLYGEVLFNEEIAQDKWKESLAAFVMHHGLDQPDRNGYYRAFVIKLEQEGYL